MQLYKSGTELQDRVIFMCSARSSSGGIDAMISCLCQSYDSNGDRPPYLLTMRVHCLGLPFGDEQKGTYIGEQIIWHVE